VLFAWEPDEPESSNPKSYTTYWRDVAGDAMQDLDWVDWQSVADTMGWDLAEITEASTSSSACARALVYEVVASHYGWHEIDNYPDRRDLREMRKLLPGMLKGMRSNAKRGPARKRDLEFAGYRFTASPEGTRVHRELLKPRVAGEDYGADPLGDGTFRMVPSGDVVDYAERERRLRKYHNNPRRLTAKQFQEYFPELSREDAETIAAQARSAEAQNEPLARDWNADAVDRVFEVLEQSLSDAGESAYFGVEPIRGQHWDGYYGDTVALYLNSGDQYNATLLYDAVKGRFMLTTRGDFVERAPKSYGNY
jgi:hypothetical protein